MASNFKKQKNQLRWTKNNNRDKEEREKEEKNIKVQISV